MQVSVLASGSKGNAIFIEMDGTRLLTAAGMRNDRQMILSRDLIHRLGTGIIGRDTRMERMQFDSVDQLSILFQQADESIIGCFRIELHPRRHTDPVGITARETEGALKHLILRRLQGVRYSLTVMIKLSRVDAGHQ